MLFPMKINESRSQQLSIGATTAIFPSVKEQSLTTLLTAKLAWYSVIWRIIHQNVENLRPAAVVMMI